MRNSWVEGCQLTLARQANKKCRDAVSKSCCATESVQDLHDVPAIDSAPPEQTPHESEVPGGCELSPSGAWRKSMQIRIPCECGQELTMDSAQAGLQVTCSCGRMVTVPAWHWFPGRTETPPPQPVSSGLTVLGWAFLILAVTCSMLATSTVDAFGLVGPYERKLRGMILGGAALLMVGMFAGILRLLGARFYRS
jgi:hypothetical protein